jgi:PhnB protein
MTTTVVPYLCVKGAAAAIDFYKRAFGANEVMRLTEPSGRIGHAEVRINEARIMLADEFPEYDILSPLSRGGSPVSISLEVDDADAVVAQAAKAGATVLQKVADQFYGDRSGKIRDPFGHTWQVSTRIEELSAEDMQRRYDEILQSSQQPRRETMV